MKHSHAVVSTRRWRVILAASAWLVAATSVVVGCWGSPAFLPHRLGKQRRRSTPAPKSLGEGVGHSWALADSELWRTRCVKQSAGYVSDASGHKYAVHCSAPAVTAGAGLGRASWHLGLTLLCHPATSCQIPATLPRPAFQLAASLAFTGRLVGIPAHHNPALMLDTSSARMGAALHAKLHPSRSPTLGYPRLWRRNTAQAAWSLRRAA